MKWWAFFAFKYLGPLQVFLIYVGFFSRPTNRRQLWRYLNKLSKENSFIQCQRYYNLSEFNILHGLAEITIEGLKVDDYTALIWSPSLGCAESLWWLQMFCLSQHNRYGLPTTFLAHRIRAYLHRHHFTSQMNCLNIIPLRSFHYWSYIEIQPSQNRYDEWCFW